MIPAIAPVDDPLNCRSTPGQAAHQRDTPAAEVLLDAGEEATSHVPSDTLQSDPASDEDTLSPKTVALGTGAPGGTAVRIRLDQPSWLSAQPQTSQTMPPLPLVPPGPFEVDASNALPDPVINDTLPTRAVPPDGPAQLPAVDDAPVEESAPAEILGEELHSHHSRAGTPSRHPPELISTHRRSPGSSSSPADGIRRPMDDTRGKLPQPLATAALHRRLMHHHCTDAASLALLTYTENPLVC